MLAYIRHRNICLFFEIPLIFKIISGTSINLREIMFWIKDYNLESNYTAFLLIYFFQLRTFEIETQSTITLIFYLSIY